MAQLSRPYQIALAALGLFAAVWFLALHRPGASTSSESSSGSAPAAHAGAAQATTPASATPVYHGSAPGLEGLTRAIAKAHGAVAQSARNARELQSKSAQASAVGAGAAPDARANGPRAAAHRTTSTPVTHQSVAKAKPSPAAPHKAGSVSRAAHERAALRATLARELKQGKVLLLLFWNPHATDDIAVHSQLSAAAAKLKGKVAVHVALAHQVGQYTSVTREVQVYGTPTLLVVGRKGQAITLTGLLDAYAIEQAVSEAAHPAKG
jgi:hypothetical protein